MYTRGTTPYITISIGAIDLTECTSLYISFGQKTKKSRCGESAEPFPKKLGDEGVDLDEDGNLIVRLSQEETLQFDEHLPVDMQVRGICDGEAFATNVYSAAVGRIIKDGVIE